MSVSSSDQAVELLNQAGLETDSGRKVDCLKALVELVVRKEPALLPEFLPHVLELQCDALVAVRKYLPDFVDAAVQALPSPLVLVASLRGLRGLLSDTAPAVSKRAVLSCYTVFRAAYVVVALQGSAEHQQPHHDQHAGPGVVHAAPLQEVWQAALELKAGVLATAAQPGNDAVRLNACKFLEQAAMLLTADMVPALAGVSAAAQPLPAGNVVFTKSALVKEAEGLLGQLVTILKLQVGSEVQGPLAITAIKAAGSVAQQRPQFMGRLLPPLLAMANSGEFRLDGNGSTTIGAGRGSAAGGVQSSIANALSGALAAVLRNQHPLALAWRKKLSDALAAMGGRPPLVAASGHAADRAAKRPRLEEQEVNKRPKLEPEQQGVQEESAVFGTGMAAIAADTFPMQRLAPSNSATDGPEPRTAASAPFIGLLPLQTSMADLQQVQQVIRTLVASRDAQTLAAFLDGLQPPVLADLVLAEVSSLPPRNILLPDSALLEPWVHQLLQLVATPPAALVPIPAPTWTQSPPTAQQRTPTPPPAALLPGVAQHAPLAPLPTQQLPAVAGFQAPSVPHPAASASGARVPLKAKVASTHRLPTALVFKLEPAVLTPTQERELRRDAVLRILRTQKTASHQLRASLVARLAALGAAEADGIVDAVVDQLLKDIHSSCGYEIALQWLHVLYSQLCEPFDAAQPAATTNGEVLEQTSEGAVAVMKEEQGASSAVSAAVAVGSGQVTAGTGQARTAETSGSRYEHVFMALLHGVRQCLPPSDRTVIRLLTDAPALPMPAATRYLEDVCAAGGDWATLALLAARDIILLRPPSREAMLQMVLEAAVAADEDTRGKAVRLLANRLFPETSMSKQIELYARQQLDAMLTAPAVAATQAESGVEGATGEQAARLPPQHNPAATAELSEDRAAQLCALYCALCTKRHSLLRHLFEIFGQSSEGGQAAIHRNASGLAKTLGGSAPALLAVMQDPPAGSLTLVLHMLHVLTEAATPPQPLVAACLQLHSKLSDARVLVPALRGMESATVLRLLPALLDLTPEALRGAFQRLVAPLEVAASTGVEQQGVEQRVAVAEPALLSPVEVLTALHTLDTGRDPKLLRKVMQAVTVCLSSPALFPPEALAASISSLLTRVPLPQLFMRTVIQTLAAAPRLRQFVVGLLGQLVGKRVWQDAAQWKGWVMCAQQTAPESFPAMLQLPSGVLDTALQQLSEGVRRALSEYASSPQCSVALPQATRNLLLLRPAA